MFSRKTFLIFIFGSLFGFSVAIIIGTISIYRNMGRPLSQPRVLGDVRVVPVAIDPKIVPGIHKAIQIEREGEIFLHLYFDDQNKIDELSYIDHSEQLFMLDMSSRESGVVYGKTMDSIHLDMNYDGTFDARWTKGIPAIFVDGGWLEVYDFERKQKKAILKQDNQDVIYIFESGKGWIQQEK
jgi:hypothetical protein